jgi:glycosyltransferase involved in cell wall biosynthesis
MRIVYVTAELPYGTDEAFVVPEISELLRCGHQVLIVPRSPGGRLLHGRDLLAHARIESLCSARVLKTAARVAMANPKRVANAVQKVLASKAGKNAAIVPKALWLAQIAQEWRADHIHCHWAGTTASMAMVASAVSAIPWSFTAHRWDIVENNLLAAKARDANFARFISEDGLAMARARGVRASDRTRIIHMGVALPRGTHPARAGNVVLCPARFVEVKGHRYLLEAWCALKERGVRGELWLAGDGELRPQLETLVRDFEIGGSVKFLGALPHDQLLTIYSQGLASMVVLASIDMGGGCHEGIPVALIEAMSFGIPVIATRTGGTPELIKSGCGLLVPGADPVALADAMERVLLNPDDAREMARRGRQRAFDSFDITCVAAELVAAFSGEHKIAANF